MDQRFLVDSITKETTDWTCKVQVIDKFRPRKSKDSSVQFHTILVQDEKEQVSIVLYSDDILKYENLFLLFHTYLVSCAKVRDPRGYSIQAGTYEWVAEKYTIVELITDNDELEAPLPVPEKLSSLPFSAIEQHPGAEFDLLAVVVNCSTLQYTADQTKHFREAIVMDQRPTGKKPFLFTIWDDLANNEGTTLLDHLHKHPIILAKRIDVTEFRGVLRLAARYQTTILPNPQYVQAITLMNWVKQNEQMLSSYTLRSSSSSSSLNLAPIEDQVQSVSTIPQSLSTVQTVPVEGRISLPDHSQSFTCLPIQTAITMYILKQKQMVHCFNCKLHQPLVPRCHFRIDITDSSGTITATMSEALAERILSLTTDQIYDKVVVQKQPLSIAGINRQLDRKLFKLQLQKSSFRFQDQKPDALVVASFTETEQTAVWTAYISPSPDPTLWEYIGFVVVVVVGIRLLLRRRSPNGFDVGAGMELDHETLSRRSDNFEEDLPEEDEI
ncbi:hypothetical protein FXO37_31243 [Capsicum annuum]|nr:hypothetical protein FXO37_31243 [Capsicum annuum]